MWTSTPESMAFSHGVPSERIDLAVEPLLAQFHRDCAQLARLGQIRRHPRALRPERAAQPLHQRAEEWLAGRACGALGQPTQDAVLSRLPLCVRHGPLGRSQGAQARFRNRGRETS